MKELPLTRGKVALVDDADYESIRSKKLHAVLAGGKWYAATNLPRGTKPRRVFLHRLLLGAGRGQRVACKDGNALNCQRDNLVLLDHAQACARRGPRGKTRYKGVFFRRGDQVWIARIVIDGKRAYCGSHRSPEEAARAYDAMARKHLGPLAFLNFPEVGSKGRAGGDPIKDSITPGASRAGA